MNIIKRKRNIKIIWIEPNIYNPKIILYYQDLYRTLQQYSNNNTYYISVFIDVKSSMFFIKNIKFIETFIIVNGSLYLSFIEQFKENLDKICIIPKIIVFTDDNFKLNLKMNYFEFVEDKFYCFGGVTSNFEDIKQFIVSDQFYYDYQTDINKSLVFKEKKNNKYIFEFIDDEKKLILPTFYKVLLDTTETTFNNNNFINILWSDYLTDINLNYLLNIIRKFIYIPLELLSKYYIRIYTCESKFTYDMRKNLMNDSKDYMPYIKTLYEGLENNSLKLASDKRLYSAGFLENDEILKIENFLENKKKNLPFAKFAIVFSKLFLSFSKDKNEAEKFFIINKPKNVLITVDKDDNIQYSLLTHADIEEFSFFPNEKEVLFFPFSAFEIKNFYWNPKDQRYEMHLDYLGKYLKKFKNDKNFMLSQ